MAFVLLPELEDDDVDVDELDDDEDDDVDGVADDEDESPDDEDVDEDDASDFWAVSLLPDFSALTLPERESFR